MRVLNGLKQMYKRLNWYNRERFIKANRPFGKTNKNFDELWTWVS